ncbi:SLOG family protein [Acrocarpospora sp. B8E8]|uniref:SLOG family protein n=1 Tax=Acrocarpospora sp. B8E8 TaxID=3153572 RepID=UPI00325E207E
MSEIAKPYRVLLTGSRNYLNRDAILATVLDIWHDATEQDREVEWVHGDCKQGADALADEILTGLGFTPERHPADWDHCTGPKCKPAHRQRRGRSGTWCPTAGLDRDARMVVLGADECVAFVADCVKPNCRKPQPHGSHGASETARLADEAGIPVRPVEP